MKSPAVTLLIIVPGLLVGALWVFLLLAEWARIVPLGNHSSVFLYHFPWRGTGIGWQPVTISGYAWIALINALFLVVLCTALVLGWQANMQGWQTKGFRLIILSYAGLAGWLVVRPGLW